MNSVLNSFVPCVKSVAQKQYCSSYDCNVGIIFLRCENTHNFLTGLCPGLPGWAGTRRNIHPLKPEEEQERFAQTTRSAFRQRGLLDPIKPAYNHSRLDGQLKLTANTFIRLWISMPAVLVAVPELLCRTCCILYQLSPLLLTILWILWCTDRWQRQMHRKSVWMPPSLNYWCPHFYHCPIFMLNDLSAATLTSLSWLGTCTK